VLLPLGDAAQSLHDVVVCDAFGFLDALPWASAVSMLLVAMAPGQPNDLNAILAILPDLTQIQSFIWSPQWGSPASPNPSVSSGASSPALRGRVKWSITVSL